MIFLDTNVVSELLRPDPHPAVAAWARAAPREEICIASFVEAELRAGIERLPEGRRKRTLGRELDRYLGANLEGRVFPFSRTAARFYAEFVAAREGIGRPAGLQDAVIAATARARGATLIATRDTGGFEGCGVALVSPWDGL